MTWRVQCVAMETISLVQYSCTGRLDNLYSKVAACYKLWLWQLMVHRCSVMCRLPVTSAVAHDPWDRQVRGNGPGYLDRVDCEDRRCHQLAELVYVRNESSIYKTNIYGPRELHRYGNFLYIWSILKKPNILKNDLLDHWKENYFEISGQK